MRRRSFLGALAALAAGAGGGCLADPPGATGPRSPPTGPPTDDEWGPVENPLFVSTFALEPTADGDLRATVDVGNRSAGARTGTVTGVLVVGGRRSERSTTVRVAGSGRATAALVYPVAYDAFERDGSFEPTVSTE